jgi:23S rRNA U2552 (ribose-2'-O)-methylase RlmE/FtsJ
MKQNFVNVVIVKPQASRAKSAELFILGRSLKNQ